jgi:hypothetical protein
MSSVSTESERIICRHLPWLSQECSRRWLGNRFFCFPRELLSFRRLSVASSRLPQRLDCAFHWFRFLSGAFQSSHPDSTIIPVVNAAAGSELISRACDLFGFSKLLIRMPADDGFPDRFASDDELRRWLEFCRPFNWASEPGRATEILRLFVSPLCDWADHQPTADPLHRAPLADRLIFSVADRICIPQVRSRGNISLLISSHLNDPDRVRVPLQIAADQQGMFPEFLQQLPSLWIPWKIIDSDNSARSGDQSTTVGGVSTSENESPDPKRLLPLPANNPLTTPTQWLCHWTRAAAGHWPGETREEYLDKLILASDPVDRSALATLLRIITDQRIRASSHAIRGSFGVTAFTAVPLTEFRRRRVFRNHRHRFDFEPWGIAIRSDALSLFGARPVRYGSDEFWRELSENDRPFFQKATHDGITDTVEEREWRLIGDVDLSLLPRQSVCVFVESEADAQLLSSVCEWPICIVPDLQGSDTFPQSSETISDDGL